ncbi:protein DMP4-like [Corylus avellana]|uniref:protein DMP4-like n=1 Tax=Corylus avellana TaxID=13451 RepID=UPI001E23D892|nr:protein DMP4-like [Corylus avellana]
MAEPISPPQPPPNRSLDHPVHKTLASVANLANLLPTGSVLAFQALTPLFSNNGSCQLPNKCLTACTIAFCAIFCLLSSFTDSFTDKDGKLYYGIATFNGLYIFNYNYGDGDVKELDKFKFKLSLVDFVHAFVSPLVFMVFAAANSNVQSCFFPEAGANESALMMNLPLGAGLFSSLLFTLFPTRRRGIGI